MVTVVRLWKTSREPGKPVTAEPVGCRLVSVWCCGGQLLTCCFFELGADGYSGQGHGGRAEAGLG